MDNVSGSNSSSLSLSYSNDDIEVLNDDNYITENKIILSSKSSSSFQNKKINNYNNTNKNNNNNNNNNNKTTTTLLFFSLFHKWYYNDINNDNNNINSIYEYKYNSLTIILRLYSLCFEEDGTKLTFLKDGVRFDPPDKWQILKRTWSKFCDGDKASRKDITLLKDHIENFVSSHNLKKQIFKTFAEGAMKGLRKLRIYCYADDPIIVHCLEYYLQLLSNGLSLSDHKEDSTTEKKYNNNDNGNGNGEDNNNTSNLLCDSDFNKCDDNKNKLSVWSVSLLNIVYTTFKELETTRNLMHLHNIKRTLREMEKDYYIAITTLNSS